MSPTEISSYLSTNILAIGISSITPMIYLSLDTIKCVSNTDHSQNVYDQCAGVLLPQQSICVFLLIMMVIKVIKVLIAPLSTTTLTANDLIKLNLPRRLIFEGVIFGISFLLNLYLFANMEERDESNGIYDILRTAIFLAFTLLSIELSHMVFHHAHRTTLAPPPQPQPPPLARFPSPTPTASPATQSMAARRMLLYK